MTDLDLSKFRDAFRGRIIEPGDADYDAARVLWNGMFDERPRLIAQCTGVADVQTAIEFARESGLVVAVRGGGHSMAGASTCEDGIVIDLSPMHGVRVDPVARIASVQGGATWATVDRETQVFGLATTGGMVSHTGVAGLTLGGGVGRLMRKHGLTCDNLLSCDVVTSDGEVLVADKDNHPELFWALRGAGAGLGVVTNFQFALHPVGPTVIGGYLGWPLHQTHEAIAAMRELLRDAPVDLTVQLMFTTAPAVDFMPVELHNQKVFFLSTSWTGPLDEGEELYGALRKAVPPAIDLLGPIAYAELQRLPDVLAPHGRRAYNKSGYFREITPEVIDASIRIAERSESPFDLLELYLMGDAVTEVDDDATAFSPRDSGFFYSAVSVWLDAQDDDRQLRWAAEVDAEFEPFRTPGRYINFVAESDEESAREALGDRTYDRLGAVKERYDPTNLFSRNPNVRRRAAPVVMG